MSDQDWELLKNWVENHKEHRMSFLEKQAIKAVLSRAGTVEDLLKTALEMLKKQG